MLLILCLTARGESPDDPALDDAALITETRASVEDTRAHLDSLAGPAARRSAEAVACIDRMRGNVDALGRVAEEAIPKHAEHSAAGRTDEATHELRKLAVIDAKVDQYRAEAERCLEEPRVSPPPRPRPRQASGPDPTDTPAYYALDGMGWESAWGRQLAEITPLDASE